MRASRIGKFAKGAAFSAVLAALMAFSTNAQDMGTGGPVGAAIGSILVTNRVTATVHAREVHTFDGVEVVVQYESTPNYAVGQDPRDIVTVFVPDGYIAIPSDALVPEGDTLEILIYKALLG